MRRYRTDGRSGKTCKGKTGDTPITLGLTAPQIICLAAPTSVFFSYQSNKSGVESV